MKHVTFWKKNSRSNDNNETTLELQPQKTEHKLCSQELIDLPPELLLLILHNLEIQAFRTFRQCCKKIAVMGVFVCFEQLVELAKVYPNSVESLKWIKNFFKYFDDYLTEGARTTLTDLALQLLMKTNKYSSVSVVPNSLYNAMQLRHKTALQFDCNSPIQYLKLRIKQWDEKNKHHQKNTEIQKEIAELKKYWDSYLKNRVDATQQNSVVFK